MTKIEYFKLFRLSKRFRALSRHGTTRRHVAAMFIEERPTLRPLPMEPFRYYHTASARCIETVVSRSTRPNMVRRQARRTAVHFRVPDEVTLL